MIAMQYNIVLPSDYDMEIIRKRVKASGSKTDGFPDLAMKAYLVAEKGKYDNVENQYAPFYVWERSDGMNQFLLGGPFNNIINSFGFPKVQNWITLHSQIEKKQCTQYVSIQKNSIAAHIDFSSMCAAELNYFNNLISNNTTTAYITAYNPLTWEIVRFHMSTDLDMIKQLSKETLIYDVHHIS